MLLFIAIDSNNELYALEYERHRSVPTIGSKNPDTGELLGKKGVVDIILELHQKYNCTSQYLICSLLHIASSSLITSIIYS